MGNDVARRVRRVVEAELPLEEMCRRFDAELRRDVPYDVGAWSTVDPATGLSTACILCGIPEDEARESAIFSQEFVEGEPATYLSLIRDGRTTAILTEETDGDLSRAGRWREVFAAFGVTDELRAVAWADDQAWGTISLYRMGGTFSRQEAEVAAAIAPAVGDGIRLSLLRSAARHPEAVEEPPGIVEVGRDGHLVAVTTPAERWLELGGHMLASAARHAAAAIRENAAWPGATSRVQTGDGHLLALHAASSVRDDGTVVVIVEAARRAQVGAMIVDAYGLTARQRDVLGLLLLGRSMTQLAGELGISEHTANDHRKAIYQRLGVNSRSELAALLQHEQYDPRHRAGATPSPYGGFLTS